MGSYLSASLTARLSLGFPFRCGLCSLQSRVSTNRISCATIVVLPQLAIPSDSTLLTLILITVVCWAMDRRESDALVALIVEEHKKHSNRNSLE
ncbi:hypothetical protein BDV10DRAFT_172187 [Aspergillus recurvatus]